MPEDKVAGNVEYTGKLRSLYQGQVKPGQLQYYGQWGDPFDYSRLYGWYLKQYENMRPPPGTPEQQGYRVINPYDWSKEIPKHYGIDAWEGKMPDTYEVEGEKYARGFWEDPQRVVKYKSMVDAGTAPEWIDANMVNSAYAYLSSKLVGVPPEKWTYLPDDDPAVEILRSIPAPDNPALYEIEKKITDNNAASQLNTGSWKNLGWAQKAMMLTMNPGGVTGMGTGAKTAGKYLSPVMNALMMGMAGAALTKNPIAGALIGTLTYTLELVRTKNQEQDLVLLPYDMKNAPIPPVNDLASWSANAINTITGAKVTQREWDSWSDEKKRKYIDDYNEGARKSKEGDLGSYDKVMRGIGKIFNFLSENAEISIGLLELAVEDRDFGTVLDLFNKNSANRIAAQLTYEVGGIGDLPNDIAGLLSGKGMTGKGEVWQTSQGIADPVKVNYATGVDAIQEMRDKILAGEDPEAVLDAYRQKFGAEGLINDFAWQLLLDPLNFSPAMGAAGVKNVGRLAGDVNLEQAGRAAGYNLQLKKYVTRVDKTTGETRIFERDTLGTVGRAMADIIPGGQLIFPAISGGRIQPSGGLLASLGAYKSFLQWGVTNPGDLPTKYTRIQRIIGGLTDEGKVKNIEPGVIKKGLNPLRWSKWFSELDPVSKALNMSYNTMDVIARIWEDSDGDIIRFKRNIEAISRAEPGQLKSAVDKILNPVDAPKSDLDPRFFNSPIALSVSDAIKKFLDSGKFEEALAVLEKTKGNRLALANFAKAFGLSEAEIIKMAKNKGTDWAKEYERVLDPARKQLIADAMVKDGFKDVGELIKTQLDPFLKKVNPAPYSTDLFGRTVAHSFYQNMGDYMMRRYGIDKDPIVYRFSGMLKNIQSIVLLGGNPRYFINNELNNVITRVATGIFGYRKDYQKTIDKYALDVARGDIEANFMTVGDVEGLPKGIGSRNDDARAKWIEKVGRGAKDVNKKIGIFSRASGFFEGVESKNSFVVAFEGMFKKLFKPVIDSQLRVELDGISPGLANKIEARVRAGGTMKEVMKNLQGDFVIPEETVGKVARIYADASFKTKGEADSYVDMLTKTGIMDELNDAFKGVTNPTDSFIGDVFDKISSKKMDYVTKLMDDWLETHIQDTITRVSSGNPADVQAIITEVELRKQLTRLNVLSDLDHVYQYKGVYSKEAFNRMLNTHLERHAQQYANDAKFAEATYKAMYEGLGVDANDPNMKLLLDSFGARNDLNKSFFDQKKSIYEKYDAQYKDATVEEYINAMETKAAKEVEALHKRIASEETKIQDEADAAMYNLMGQNPEVKAWRESVKKIRNELHKLVDDYRISLAEAKKAAVKAGRPLSPAEVNASWSQFFQEQYFPKFTEAGWAEVTGSQAIHASATPGTQAFDAWFKGSKVVDKDGKPIIVYHGTTTDIGGGFSLDYAKPDGTVGKAFYFSDKPEYASKFATVIRGGNNVNIVPVYLDMKNPLYSDIVEWDANPRTRLNDALRQATGLDTAEQLFHKYNHKPELRQMLLDAGYDGVIFISESGADYAVFNPDQIRSSFSVNANSVPQPTPQNPAIFDGFNQHLLPYLDSVKAQMIMDSKTRPTVFKELSPDLQNKVIMWAQNQKQNMINAKYASVKYGQVMRDLSMLNYQNKTNFDNMLNTVFPYQFWFTNTMRNWLLRSVDKASWYNTYFRYKQMQERLEKDGLPTRLGGKMAMPMPFLPEWMGDTVWFDAMAQVFPFTQMFQPFQNIARIGTDIEHEATGKVWDMVAAQTISRAEAEAAINSKQGRIWESAYAQASEEANTDPMTLASLMMSPAMWIDIPQKILQDRGDEISMTPMGKTSQALQTQLEETFGNKNILTGAVGAPSWLETNIRKAAGMSVAVAKYGQYGDYYIERELANMVFDGRASLDEARQAMISHEGALYAQADQNVARQLSLKTPGMLTIEALRGDANAAQTINSFFLSFFPLGLLPQGELKYKNIQMEFNDAWEYYKQTGDKSKVSQLYDQYPEMAARTALYESDPEARMRQYIIGKIWDAYGTAGAANKTIIKNALGEDFQISFLDKETRNEDAVSLETLMTWARRLNVIIPKNDVVETSIEEPTTDEAIEMFSPLVAEEYQKFVDARNQMFPFWYANQQLYYDQPEGDRKMTPEYKEYVEWKSAYTKSHPIISVVLEANKNVDVSKYETVKLSDLDPLLVKQLSNYYTTGETLSAGAWELLYEQWIENGKPYNDFHKWMAYVVAPAITGQAPKEQEYTNVWSKLGADAQAKYNAYKMERDSKFPGITNLLDEYFNYPKGSAMRSAILKTYPILGSYFDWVDQYEEGHPEILEIKKSLSEYYD